MLHFNKPSQETLKISRAWVCLSSSLLLINCGNEPREKLYSDARLSSGKAGFTASPPLFIPNLPGTGGVERLGGDKAELIRHFSHFSRAFKPKSLLRGGSTERATQKQEANYTKSNKRLRPVCAANSKKKRKDVTALFFFSRCSGCQVAWASIIGQFCMCTGVYRCLCLASPR